MVGTCRYCGQAAIIENSEEMTQDELDREATRRCNCEAGESERRVLTMIEQGKNIIEETVEPSSSRAAAILREGVEAVCRGYIKKVSVTIDNRVTAKMQLSKNGIYIGCRETIEKGAEGIGE